MELTIVLPMVHMPRSWQPLTKAEYLEFCHMTPWVC